MEQGQQCKTGSWCSPRPAEARSASSGLSAPHSREGGSWSEITSGTSSFACYLVLCNFFSSHSPLQCPVPVPLLDSRTCHAASVPTPVQCKAVVCTGVKYMTNHMLRGEGLHM